MRYTDKNTGKPISLNDVGIISVEYGEDDNNPGLFRVVHNFTFNQDVNICIGRPSDEGSVIHNVEKNEGDTVCLHYSYKYTTPQLLRLFRENGYKLIGKVLKPRGKHFTQAKFVIRRRLPKEIEQRMADIIKFIKKEAKKATGATVNLKLDGEVDILIQPMNKLRTIVTATAMYKIGGMKAQEDPKPEGKTRNEADFYKSFISNLKEEKRKKTLAYKPFWRKF